MKRFTIALTVIAFAAGSLAGCANMGETERTTGLPAEQFHVECCSCGVTTAPHTTVGMALGDWRKGRTIPVPRLPALRIALDLARLAVPA